METVTFYFPQDEFNTDDIQRKGLFDVPHDLIRTGNQLDIPVDILKSRINEAIEKVAGIIHTENKLPNNFQVDEIEFALNVGMDGKVSVIALESAASISSSITVKLKRKDAS